MKDYVSQFQDSFKNVHLNIVKKNSQAPADFLCLSISFSACDSQQQIVGKPQIHAKIEIQCRVAVVQWLSERIDLQRYIHFRSTYMNGRSCYQVILTPNLFLLNCLPCYKENTVIIGERLVSRRSSYQVILAPDKGESQVVERDLHYWPLRTTLVSAIGLVWYDNFGKKSTPEAFSSLPSYINAATANRCSKGSRNRKKEMASVLLPALQIEIFLMSDTVIGIVMLLGITILNGAPEDSKIVGFILQWQFAFEFVTVLSVVAATFVLLLTSGFTSDLEVVHANTTPIKGEDSAKEHTSGSGYEIAQHTP